MAVPAILLVQVEAVCVDGGCDHDAEAWRGGRRRGCQRGQRARMERQEIKEIKHEGKKLRCPKSDVNRRRLDETPPLALSLAHMGGEKSFLKTIPHLDNMLPQRLMYA